MPAKGIGKNTKNGKMGLAHACIRMTAQGDQPVQSTLENTWLLGRGSLRDTSKAVLDSARPEAQGDPDHSPGEAGAGKKILGPQAWQQNVDKPVPDSSEAPAAMKSGRITPADHTRHLADPTEHENDAQQPAAECRCT